MKDGADVEYWRAIQRRAPAYSYSKYLKGIDMYQNEDGKIVQVEEDRRIYKKLWVRTLKNSFLCNSFLFFNGLSNCSFARHTSNEI